ncbi:MAG: GIY-YIG nuclease family protein [Candidatus Peribacter sp.]|nr:GIY-YIG nuclease family protein [Candidatus Peribacter sp.]
MFYVYVLQNPKGILYKGYTSDLQKRLGQHSSNKSFPSFTCKRGPWKLVYKEKYENQNEAKDRESFLKSGKGRAFLKTVLGRLSAKADG